VSSYLAAILTAHTAVVDNIDPKKILSVADGSIRPGDRVCALPGEVQTALES
jgi:hypothetical protein